MIVLGQQVKDRVSGFRGVVIARTEYLYASPQVWIQPETLNEGGMPKEKVWLEEAQVESAEVVSHVPNFRSSRLAREQNLMDEEAFRRSRDFNDRVE